MFKQSVIWFRSAPLQLTAVVEGVTALLPCLTELILMCLNEDLVALQKITPICLAARAGAVQVCELLLSRGADQHAQDQAVSRSHSIWHASVGLL